MDGLVLPLIAQAAGIILGVMCLAAVSIYALSRRKSNKQGSGLALKPTAAIATSIIAIVLLGSVVLVGASFFNDPQYIGGETTSNHLPYDIERIGLVVVGLLSIGLWVRYLRAKTR